MFGVSSEFLIMIFLPGFFIMKQDINQSMKQTWLVRVLIRPKKNILDPKGQALEKAFQQMELSSGIQKVRVGKLIEISIEIPMANKIKEEPKKETKESTIRKQINVLCQDLLSNPITEEYEYEILQPTS